MLTLEKVKKETINYYVGMKLICYENYYGFIRSYPYHIHSKTEDGDYIILDCDRRPVIFSTNLISKYFMPR